MNELQLIPVKGVGEVEPGMDLAQLFSDSFPDLQDNDILVVSSKVISKAEGRIFYEDDLVPSKFAYQLSSLCRKSPAYCELVLRESAGILRTAPGVVICRTHHGFVMANAGVDASNTGGPGRLIPLPQQPDESARKLGLGLQERSGKKIAVIIADTFGRAWRRGQTNLAIGSWGMAPLLDFSGVDDNDGRTMSYTCIAVADELASAADLVAGKTGRIPGVVVRGYSCQGEGCIQDVLMPARMDLFP